ARPRVLPRGYVLAAAGRRSDRSDGGRSHLQPPHVGYAAASAAVRLRGRRAVAALLRTDRAGLEPRAGVAEEVLRARADRVAGLTTKVSQIRSPRRLFGPRRTRKSRSKRARKRQPWIFVCFVMRARSVPSWFRSAAASGNSTGRATGSAKCSRRR